MFDAGWRSSDLGLFFFGSFRFVIFDAYVSKQTFTKQKQINDTHFFHKGKLTHFVSDLQKNTIQSLNLVSVWLSRTSKLKSQNTVSNLCLLPGNSEMLLRPISNIVSSICTYACGGEISCPIAECCVICFPTRLEDYDAAKQKCFIR